MSPSIYLLLLIAASVFAFVRGSTDERFAASVCIAASLASVLVAMPLRSRFHGVEGGIMAVDVVTLAAFTALALRSKHFWPLWIAGLQLTTEIAHVMKAADPTLFPQVYAAAAQIWSYPILFILLIGTWRTHHRRLREG